jgi:DNA-directed RNA polymerase I, II, and III subunit RPABC1
MDANNEVHKAFATIKEMLRDRDLDPEGIRCLQSLSGADVLALSASRNVFFVDLDGCNHRVIFDLNQKFKLADIRKFLEVEGGRIIIVVTKEKAPPAALKGVADLKRDIQFFALKELQYNPSRHMLVPRHRAIRDEGVIEELVTRYSLKSRYQLPIILSTDVMARYLALKPGQVVEITRPSPSAGTYKNYRCCMRGT